MLVAPRLRSAPRRLDDSMVSENDIERLEEKVDDLRYSLERLALKIEHRVTKLEVKTALYGVMGGAIVTIASAFFPHVR